jgi:hypothetical protein
MNLHMKSTLHAGVQLVQNELLNPARREDFDYCFQVWGQIINAAIEIAIPIVQLLWDIGCAIAVFTAVEAVKLSEKLAELIEYWWENHREAQMAAVQAWVKAQKPKVHTFIVWVVGCYTWFFEQAIQSLEIEEEACTASNFCQVTTHEKELTMPAVAESNAIVDEAIQSQSLAKDLLSTTDVTEAAEDFPTENSLRTMLLKDLRILAPSMGIENAHRIPKGRLIPLMIEQLQKQPQISA